MKIKRYNGLLPLIKFYRKEDTILLKYNNKLFEATEENINLLKEYLELPYKLSFYGININRVINILNILNDEKSKLFFYRENDLKNNLIMHHAIFLEKEKVKRK